jgi:hypothetical protein
MGKVIPKRRSKRIKVPIDRATLVVKSTLQDLIPIMRSADATRMGEAMMYPSGSKSPTKAMRTAMSMVGRLISPKLILPWVRPSHPRTKRIEERMKMITPLRKGKKPG